MDNLKKFSAAMANGIRMENSEESHEDLDVICEMTFGEFCEMILDTFPEEYLNTKVGNLFGMIGKASDYDDFHRMMDEMG